MQMENITERTKQQLSTMEMFTGDDGWMGSNNSFFFLGINTIDKGTI